MASYTYSSSIRHFRPDSPVACRSSGPGEHTGVNCCTGTLHVHMRDFRPTSPWLTNTSIACERNDLFIPNLREFIVYVQLLSALGRFSS